MGFGVDLGEEAAARGGVVAGQGPEDTAGGDLGSKTGYEIGQEGEEEETDGTCSGAGCLTVYFGQREEVGAVEDGVKIGDAVEDGDEVEETAQEAEDVLRKDCFGDVGAGTVF